MVKSKEYDQEIPQSHTNHGTLRTLIVVSNEAHDRIVAAWQLSRIIAHEQWVHFRTMRSSPNAVSTTFALIRRAAHAE